ncbi:MAG TPA: histidine kinase, partial [Streptosporangiaceae bacterium]|nr:histidine kinase [Streptosporangiaceae bacterium]
SFCVLLIGYVLGLGLLPLALAGVPVLGVTQRCAGWFAQVERQRFGAVLGRYGEVRSWPAGTRAGYRWGIVPRLGMLRDRSAWFEALYGVVVRPAVSMAFAAVNLVTWSIGLVLVTLPLYSRSLPDGGAVIGGTVLRGTLVSVVAVLAGAGLLVVAPQVSRGLAVADVGLTRRLLSPPSDLQARVTELEISRERVVDAAEAERRRIERDLHDGAQQRLVALAMELGRAKARFDSDMDGARELVDQAHEQAKAALTELRNLVRGVHPPVLTDRGLDAALSGLAALSPVPVEVHVDVPVRPRQAIEAIAYFTVAEALTNVAKHSRATHASVVVESHGFPGTLAVMITDDGVGGAAPTGGGLRGLADRVAGVDGTLSIESPVGGPTIIAVELPCA